jgi:hypothetical protein
MGPLAVLNAIIFGSATAITFGLSAVVIVYLILQQRHPQLAEEFGLLLQSDAVFACLAVISGVSLFAMLKGLRWRWIAQMAMWLTVAATCAWYWPK